MRNPPRQRKRTTSSPPCTVEATCITSHQRGNRQHQRANDTHQPEDRHATRSGGQPPRSPPRWHTPVSVTRTPCHTYTLGCRFCNQRQLNIENRPQLDSITPPYPVNRVNMKARPVEAPCDTSHQRGNRQHQRGKPPRSPPRWHTPSVTDSVTRNDLIYRESASTVKSDSLGHLFIKFFYSLVLGCLAACLLARLIHRSPQIQSLLLGKFAPLLCFFDLVQHLN